MSRAIGAAKGRGANADHLIQEARTITRRLETLLKQADAEESADRGVPPLAGPLTVSVESSAEVFRELGTEWNELLLRSECDSPFLTWEWLYTWWTVFGEDKELYLVLVRAADGKLVGAAPLMIGYWDWRQPNRLHRRMLAFLGTGACPGPNYLRFIALPDREAEITGRVLDRMAEDAGRWDLAMLRHVPCEQGENTLLAQLAAQEKLCAILEGGQACVWSPLGRSFEEYLRAVPSKSRRRGLRDGEQKLREKFGRVAFSFCDSPDTLPEHLQGLIDLHLSRFRAKGERSNWESPRVQLLMKRMARRFQQRGWLSISALKLDGQLAACEMGFVFKDTYFALQSGVAPQFEAFRLTEALDAYGIQRLIRQGVKSYDFLGGPYTYKRQYSRHRRYVTSARVFPNSRRHRFKMGRRLVVENIAPVARELVRRVFAAGTPRAETVHEPPTQRAARD